MESEITPSFSAEVQFAGFSDSSKGGPRITLRLADREALESFIGCEGKRFMAVLVLIGDDELPAPPPQPAPKPAKPKAPKADHSRSQSAADLCRNPEFWRWIEFDQKLRRYGRAPINDEKSAADWMRDYCEVGSRAHFDTDPAAHQRFVERVKAPWSRHCIARGLG